MQPEITHKVTVVENDTDSQEIEIVYDNPGRVSWTKEAPDPFNIGAEDFKKYSGLTPAFKKKAGREFQKFATGDSAGSKIPVEPNAYRLTDAVPPPHNLDYLAQLYEISAPHKAAVDAKVSNIVGLGWDWVESPATLDALQRSAGDDDKIERVRRKVERTKQALNEWLDKLNKEATFEETMKRVWTDYETMGNGYLEVSRITKGPRTGEIGYIGHVPAQILRVRHQRDGYVHIAGREFTFFRNFGDTTTPNPIGGDRNPNEIIHFKKFSPTNTYYGVPDIIAAKNAVAGVEFAERFNLDYFEHKAVPRYVIVVKGARLSATAEQRLIEFFTTGLKGKNHRTMYIPLPEGDNVEFDMKPVEAGTSEGSFEDYINQGRDTILMAHRVPITKISVTGGVALAAARDADKTFKEQVTRPEQKLFDKKFNKVVEEKTDILKFKLNELTLTDALEQAKIDEIYARIQARTPNEVRRRQGEPGLPDGDEPPQLTPQQAAEERTETSGNRQRDQQRQSSGTDSNGTGRNEQGAGRATG